MADLGLLRAIIEKLRVRYRGLTYNLDWRDGQPSQSNEEPIEELYSLWLKIKEIAPATTHDHLEKAWVQLRNRLIALTLRGVMCIDDENPQKFERYRKEIELPEVDLLLNEVKDLVSTAQAACKRRKKPIVDEDGDLIVVRTDKTPILMGELRQWEAESRNRRGKLIRLPPIKHFYERCNYTANDANHCKHRQPEFYEAYRELKSQQLSLPIHKRRQA